MGHRPSQVATLVATLPPFDAAEREHQAAALAWLAGTRDIYRRVKPRTPSPHLVSYSLLVEPSSWSVFLVDHRLSGLWLPAGGHVEPFEDPVETARREAMEELGISADLPIAGPRPLTPAVSKSNPPRPGPLPGSRRFARFAPGPYRGHGAPAPDSSGAWGPHPRSGGRYRDKA